MGVVLREAGGPQSPSVNDKHGHAPEELGAYSRASVSWLEGTYLTLRPSFGDPNAIFAYCTEIAWDGDRTCLGFRERERSDASFSQQGSVSVPHLSGHIYLVTNSSGQYRMAILSRPSITGEMFGLLTTLRAGQGSHLTPVSTPIALLPISAFTQPSLGRILAADHHHEAYSAIMRRITGESYAGFVG